jgi:hypothetical protein
MYQRSKAVKDYFRTIAGLAVILMGSALVPALKADEWDKKTNITIDQAIEVQGIVLHPGSYVIKIVDSPQDRSTVQIYNSAENHLIATVPAIPAYRLELAGNSEFKFYGVAEGRPPALHTWFYPGDYYGIEFRLGWGEAAAQSMQRHRTDTTSNAGGD